MASRFFASGTASLTPQKRGRVAAAADAGRKGSFLPQLDPTRPPHTLLLGTQPSDNSLHKGTYFATDANKFWHIVGDALGFRRGWWCSAAAASRGVAPEGIAPHLLHDEAVEYDEAMRRLLSRGYCMWDIIESAERKGSLDSSIIFATAVFADVEGLLRAQPSIRRVVFSTGKQSAALFLRAHRAADWLCAPGAFRPAADPLSEEVFGAHFARLEKRRARLGAPPAAAASPIELCVVESVSPAANPIATWNVAAQREKGYAGPWSGRPVAPYAYARADWFEKVFHDEPVVKAAPPLGEKESDFRPAAEAVD